MLNADHRHVCKFKDTMDSNYITLRNAFGSKIDQIEKGCKCSEEHHQSRSKRVATYITKGWRQLTSITLTQ